MAKLQLRLSEPELIFALTVMQVASYPMPGRADLASFSTEQRQAALQTARAAMIARGLARTNAKGDIELNPLVVAAVGITVRPEAGYWLSYRKEGTALQAVYYNWSRTLIISNWVDADHTHHFEQVAGKDGIAADILARCQMTVAVGGGEPKFVLPLPVLQQITQEGISAEDRLMALKAAGLAGEVAIELGQVLGSPALRASLVAVGNMRQQPSPVGTIGWFVHQERLWLAVEAVPGSGQVVIRRGSAASLSQVVNTLISQAIEATPAHPLV